MLISGGILNSPIVEATVMAEEEKINLKDAK
jgi:hypothetical protein